MTTQMTAAEETDMKTMSNTSSSFNPLTPKSD